MFSHTKSQTYTINPTGADGIVRCYCNEPALFLTSKTRANPNREFYCCSKDREDKARCRFWSDYLCQSLHICLILTPCAEWQDELEKATQPPPQSQAQMPSQPTPSQRQRADIARGSMTPSPKKRSQSPGSSQMTPSQKRLADIEAALGESGVDPGKQKRLADIEAGLESASQVHPPPQTVSGSDDDDVFYSTVSPSESRSTHVHIHIPPPDAPRTPKRQRLDRDASSNSSLLMTPPRTDGRELRNVFTDCSPESPLKRKRKEMEDDEGEMSQWQKIMGDHDSPYHERAAALRGASQSGSFQTVPTSSQTTDVPSKATPESIKTLISDLSSTLPAYIAKLERRQFASEKSNEAKARKIEELQKEINR